MISLSAGIRKLLFGISPEETTFSRRGFNASNPEARALLERVGAAFVLGYHAALEESRESALLTRLNSAPLAARGFAFEGAAMGLALRDWFTPWNRCRIRQFLNGAGDPHTYMVHVGAGWLLARVPGNPAAFMAQFEPLLRWLVMDGYGFHEAFFHWPKYLREFSFPRRVSGYGQQVFAQGFGRCLWFVEGGDVKRIAETISRLPAEFNADFWSGVGLASVYAGEIAEPELNVLRETSGKFAPELAQGAAFAAKARQRANNATPYQDLACRVVCGMDATEAAMLTDEALENLPADGELPAYEIWRRRIQEKFLHKKGITT